jgi:hypothetical protein
MFRKQIRKPKLPKLLLVLATKIIGLGTIIVPTQKWLFIVGFQRHIVLLTDFDINSEWRSFDRGWIK